MYGYSKTLKLSLTEYVAVIMMHTLYAYLVCGPETGRMVLFGSVFILSVTFVIAFFVKKQRVVVFSIIVSVLLSNFFIGYLINALSFSILICGVLSVCITLFMETLYIVWTGVLSLAGFTAFIIFAPEKIFENLESPYMFFIYVLCYVVLEANLYVVVHFARKYMKGMEEKAAEAEAANASKMIFLANMSHEIRTPMNAICGMAELALRDKNLTGEVRENVESIQTSGRVLISIVNDILDYSKLESGKMEIIPVTYSFRQLVDDVLALMTVRMEDKEVDISAEIQEGLPDLLIGDEIRIRQILFNLLSNALKYTEKGYVLLDVKGKRDGDFVDLTISVTDSGIGIKKEDLPKLFTSFQHIDTRKTRNREGTGLGLAICKELLTFMGGSIEVESTYGVGSKFTFNISQKISGEEEHKKDTYNENEARINAPDAKVLVVDDNAVNLKVAQGLLRTFGISVDTCTSGRECLEILRTTKDYDIIFIDHMMPELDGIDTLNLIRADSSEYMKKVPLIALTANVVSGVRDMFISEGFDDYVAKPIDMIWLNGILRKFLPIEKQR